MGRDGEGGVAQWREGGWLRKVMDDLVEGRVANAMHEWCG
jgi:hypothetical protein